MFISEKTTYDNNIININGLMISIGIGNNG